MVGMCLKIAPWGQAGKYQSCRSVTFVLLHYVMDLCVKPERMDWHGIEIEEWKTMKYIFDANDIFLSSYSLHECHELLQYIWTKWR